MQTDLFSLDNSNALITGATGHLGKAMAHALAEAGANVMINGRNRLAVNSLVSELQALGHRAEAAVFDLTSDEQVRRFCQSITGRPIRVLVNGAYSGGGGTIEVATEDEYRQSYEIGLIATHRLFKGMLENLRKAVAIHGEASVVNVATMYAQVSPNLSIYKSKETANPPFYGAAKAALAQWTRYAACEYGRENIRVNCLSPGPFPASSVQQELPDFIDRLREKVPLYRIGHPHEMRGPLVFLASSASSFVTGANIAVDGGWTSW